MTRDYTCPPNDYAPCPECGAPGGPDGTIRARGVMTDREYNDRRCNGCGHLWTSGDTLELPLGEPEKPTPSGVDVENYDFGNGFVRENPEIPF